MTDIENPTKEPRKPKMRKLKIQVNRSRMTISEGINRWRQQAGSNPDDLPYICNEMLIEDIGPRQMIFITGVSGPRDIIDKQLGALDGLWFFFMKNCLCTHASYMVFRRMIEEQRVIHGVDLASPREHNS